MEIKLADFQRKAIGDLMEAMEKPNRDIILKSCTGSGKTIILTHFMEEYCQSHGNTVFIWLTPGRGDLEEQSKEKMDRYLHASRTKLLPDVLSAGFEAGDACFINWEKLTKKGSNALKEGERFNFPEQVERAREAGCTFKVIVDESHQNNTVKAADILDYFKADKIIRCSATPREDSKAILIEIPEEVVIAQGLIKKMLVINENFPKVIRVEDEIRFLLEKALDKQRELRGALLQRGIPVNPLIIVQLPNRSEELRGRVEGWFEAQGETYENRRLAVWLSEEKRNLEGIEAPDAAPDAVIIKQAVATGWDCPRAYILVKLRDNMNETFEIQTIGRIRRMPMARHYESDLLDSCYLYTLDEKFTIGVKNGLGKGALDAVTLNLKPEHRTVTLTGEQKTARVFARDGAQALKAIAAYYTKTFGLDRDMKQNRAKLEAQGYLFQDEIVDVVKSGTVRTLQGMESSDLDDVKLCVPLNTHVHGRAYHHQVGEISLRVGLDYSQVNAVLRKLFDRNAHCPDKLLALETREVYAFVLNNFQRLKDAVRGAMAQVLDQDIIRAEEVKRVTFTIPRMCMFTYDGTAKVQTEMKKNVYAGYLASAEPRSASEKKFERFCETSPAVEWVYKNGDKGAEYFSIVYYDSFGKQRSFYPDYLLSVDGALWIIETKGGFDRTGKSEDVDPFSPLKFQVLRRYLDEHGLRGGFVREDKQSQELCICSDQFCDDIKSEHWQLLSSVLGT